MPYSTTITALDLSDGIANVRVTAGYAYTQVGPLAEIRQNNVTLDIDRTTFTSTNPNPFSYAGSLAPPPDVHWDIALWIQEIPRIASDSGWLFRSGAFQTEPPAEALEIIVAPMMAIGAAELATAIGTLPIISGKMTINTATITVSGTNLLLSAAGTHTDLPAGISFTFTATLVLTPNPSVRETEEPFALQLDNPNLSFVAGPGTGFATALLNVIRGPIFDRIKPNVLATLGGLVNNGVLSTVGHAPQSRCTHVVTGGCGTVRAQLARRHTPAGSRYRACHSGACRTRRVRRRTQQVPRSHRGHLFHRDCGDFA